MMPARDMVREERPPAPSPAHAVEIDARAKINLALHVTGRRADGYHLLDSLVVFADIADRITATPATALSLRLSGPFGAGLSAGPDNLVLRAAAALAAATGDAGRGAALHLAKHLPVASGIGGGSADAAATLIALQALWGVDLPEADIAALGLALGADVPVCLSGCAVRMRGVGEFLSAVPALPPAWLVLANAGLPVKTPAVFAARSAPFSSELALPGRFANAADLAGWLATHSRNDLEAPARTVCAPIGTVLEALAETDACLLARMSGSGGTCFGLYATEAQALAAASRLAGRCTGNAAWWVRPGMMAGGPMADAG